MRIKYLFYISQNYSYAILRPLQDAISLRGDTVCWFLEGDNVNSDYLADSEVRLAEIKDIYQYQPDVIIYTANTVPTFLPGINVTVFHGFDAGKLDNRGRNDHFKIRNCFDLYCTQGPSSTKPFCELEKKHQNFKVVETGWCALDPLFKQGDVVDVTEKKTILLCSTFSSKLTCAPHLFDTVKRLSQSGKWQWLIQFHPKMAPSIVAQYKSIEGDNLRFIDTDDVTPLLDQADVMVCDTSSVLMMFLLQNKPVVTYKNISPQGCLIDINNPDLLEKSIEHALSRPAELMSKIESFIKETHPYHDGQSSSRVLDAVEDLLSDTTKLKRRPLDLIRQLKIRKKLNFWKFE